MAKLRIKEGVEIEYSSFSAMGYRRVTWCNDWARLVNLALNPDITRLRMIGAGPGTHGHMTILFKF